MGERSLSPGPLTKQLVPLAWRHRSVARICLAYQAYKDPVHRHLFPGFLNEALELFKACLIAGEVTEVAILVTGIFICSVSVCSHSAIFHYLFLW
jgi:hypothetical protein